MSLYLIRNIPYFYIILGIIFPITLIDTINYTKKELNKKIYKPQEEKIKFNNKKDINKVNEKTITLPKGFTNTKEKCKILIKKW